VFFLICESTRKRDVNSRKEEKEAMSTKQPPPKDSDKYYEDTNKIKLNPQGGKQFGREWQQRENNLRQIAEQYR
jgi:hypothetical protein